MELIRREFSRVASGYQVNWYAVSSSPHEFGSLLTARVGTGP